MTTLADDETILLLRRGRHANHERRAVVERRTSRTKNVSNP
jgi:hypothetical protein